MHVLILSMLMSHAGAAMAHEYWLDPVGTQWKSGDMLQADIRNGQDFTGTPYPFDPHGLARAGLISDQQRRPLTGRLGDYPAIQIPVNEAGLNLLLLETTQRELKYKDYNSFETFLDYHALGKIKQRHRELDLPTTDIIEHYFRYCKALVMVDTADGASGTRENVTSESRQITSNSSVAALLPQNQRFELVALDNPFDVDFLSLQLLFEGTPVGHRQIELFHRDSRDAVVRTTADTDDKGVAVFDVSSVGDYLINSVLVLESDSASAHWITLWASLLFQQTD